MSPAVAGTKRMAIPYRECSTCRVALEPEEIPLWRGNGTDQKPHYIERFVQYLRCPQCKHARPLKNPDGARTANRKTNRTTFADVQRIIHEADRAYLYDMVVALYQRQTPEERRQSLTLEENGQGFSQWDAGFFSSIVKSGRVSINQESSVRRSLIKYRRQLAEIYRVAVSA